MARRAGGRGGRGGNGELRITGGEVRGRRLRAAPGSRPTAERVREALFSTLGPLTPPMRVLDAFCGGGTLGIEALSRGAGSCRFVDSSSRSLAVARDNLKTLALTDRAELRRSTLPPGDASANGASNTRAETTPAAFDRILSDPPYDVGDLCAIAAWLARSVAPGGVVVLEHSRRHADADTLGLPATWSRGAQIPERVRQKDYGETQLTIVEW